MCLRKITRVTKKKKKTEIDLCVNESVTRRKTVVPGDLLGQMRFSVMSLRYTIPKAEFVVDCSGGRGKDSRVYSKCRLCSVFSSSFARQSAAAAAAADGRAC